VNFLMSPNWLRNKTVFPSMNFDLGERDLSGVVFTLKPGAMLRGHVVTVKPLPPHFSLLLTSHGKVSSIPQIQVQADGSFECPDVYPDDYDLSVLSPVPGWRVQEIRLGGRVLDTRREGIVVKDDVPLLEIKIVLDSQMTTVSGSVVDENGAPQSGVDVVLIGQSSKRWPDRPLRGATTGLDGRYHFEAVIPGDYWMVAWPLRLGLELRDPYIYAQIASETVAVHVGALPITQDLKLTPKTKEAAERMTPGHQAYVFPAARY
jgi:hypothetical protein